MNDATHHATRPSIGDQLGERYEVAISNARYRALVAEFGGVR